MSDLPLVLDHLCGYWAMTALALGSRTGLLDALLAGGGTARELAQAASVDERNARAWAGAMVVAGYATAEAGRYAPVEAQVAILRGGFPFDMRAAAELTVAFSPLMLRAEQAIRDGRGIASSEIGGAIGDLSARVNVPMFEMMLTGDWIASQPDIHARLEAGLDVAELGAGLGAALRILGAAYPASRFTGVELDAAVAGQAADAARTAGLDNIRFLTADASELPAGAFDLVLALDSFHHFGRPAEVLASVRTALRPGGALLLAESGGTGDPSLDAADPTAIITWGSDLVYCLQEGLADGGAGLGASWGLEDQRRVLAAGGFAITSTHDSRVGYRVVRAEPTG